MVKKGRRKYKRRKAQKKATREVGETEEGGHQQQKRKQRCTGSFCWREDEQKRETQRAKRQEWKGYLDNVFFFLFLFPKTKRQKESEREMSSPSLCQDAMECGQLNQRSLLYFPQECLQAIMKQRKKKPGSNEMHTLGKKGHGPRQGRGMEMHKWARLGTQEDAERQGVQA